MVTIVDIMYGSVIKDGDNSRYNVLAVIKDGDNSRYNVWVCDQG